MPTCPDCSAVKEQIEGIEGEFEYIDIGSHVHLLKEFLAIRDNDPLFEDVRKDGRAGIPCFILEDGTVTLTPEDAGLMSAGVSCSLEDHLAGKEGC